MKSRRVKCSIRKGFNFRLKPLVLSMAAVLPFSTTAGMIVDAGKNQSLNITSAANGTPLININDPNGKGISHNKYTEFDVGKQGIIFNNSMQDGVSKTGGYAIKNSQLTSEAQVILNEVTGAKGSHLAGSMEVFGRTADLIVANESGITVNGVSTVNASNLTLSTGKVNFDEAGNVRLAVERGHVSVEGAGINTEGLSYFDIVSRSAALTGEIAGSADVKIVTGLNDYDTASRSHSVRSRTASDTPAVAISGTQLGSMYGSRVQLISTESGAGVTHEGSIVGSGGIEIGADGDIRLAAAVSKNGNVSVAGRNITLNNQAGTGGVSAQNDVVLAALAGLQINADVIANTGYIRIDAGSVLQSAAGLLVRDKVKSSGAIPAIQINVADRYTLAGTLYAVDVYGNKIDGAEVTLSQGKFVVKVNGQSIAGAQVISDASLISTSGDIAINAASLVNNSGVINAKTGGLIVNLTGSLVNNGAIQAEGSVELVGSELTNAGLFNTSSELKLTSGGLENSGSMYAGRVTVAAAELNNKGIIITDNGDVAIEVTGKASNSGTVQAEESVALTAKQLEISGTVNAAKKAVLTAADLVNHGRVQGENITLVADTLGNSGSLVTNTGDISLFVDDVINSGTIQAGNAITAKAKTVRNEGDLIAIDGVLDLAVSETLNNDGTLSGSGIRAVTKNFTSSGEISAEKGHLSLEIQGGDATNSGVIQAQSGTITAVGEFYNQGDIGTINELSISAGKVTNSGEIASRSDLRLAVDSELNNAGEGAVLSANGLLAITGKTSEARVSNSDSAVIQSREGDISISGMSSLTNSEARIYAAGTLNVEQVASVSNNNAHMGGSNVNIQHIESIVNSGADALIAADGSMTIANVNEIINSGGAISAHSSLTFEKINNLLNSAAEIVTGEELKFNLLGSLQNSDGATISSLYKAIMLAGIKSISNISSSVIEAAGGIYVDNTNSLKNSDNSGIYSEGDISLKDTVRIDNAGSILASASLILDGVETLVNNGENAVLQGLDIIISKASSIVNQNGGAILAEDNLKITEVIALLNEAAAFIQANEISIESEKITNAGYESQIAGINNLTLIAKEIVNDEQAGIFSDNGMNIIADTLTNETESTISASIIDISAGKFHNMGEGEIYGEQSLTLNLQGDYNNAEGMLRSNNKLAINATGDVTIDKAIESFGSVEITANNIYNNESIVSANSIYLTAINIVNNINSLIYSMKNSVLSASDSIINKFMGNILGQNEIIMKAGKIHNQAGVIRSESDMWLDAKEIHNESTYKNVSWDYGTYVVGKDEIREGDFSWSKYHSVTINIPGMTSDIALDTRAEISSGGNLYINKNSTSEAVVKNDGGLIQAKKDVLIRGDIYNAPKYVSASVLEYLETRLSQPIVLYFYSSNSFGLHQTNEALQFSSIYQMLNYLYGDGIDNNSRYGNVDSDSREKFTKAIQKLGSSHSYLNELMNKLFGEQWKISSYSALQSRWENLRDILSGKSNNMLAEMKCYFLPGEKAAIVAGNNFVHSGGSLNNGIASEVAGDVRENQIVDVEIGDKAVTTIEQGYEVVFNKKNIAEISLGFGTLPTVSILTSIKGLFAKSQSYIDYEASLSKAGSAVQSQNAATQAGEAAKSRVVPMYETRPSMIDQSQYFGSDYFFNVVGYNSSQPVVVIGDNYFISELLRRQINETMGSFYTVKYGIEGADLVQMLFDNAGKALDSEVGSSFVVGQALTQAQIESLQQDIVWFVTEKIDGIDVLVPRVYLASQTLEEVKTSNENGVALVHAGNDAVVDASNIQNVNAVINSGNNLQLAAEGDINNISSGMNAGIKAGGSAAIVSNSGDVINSGSAISAGDNVSLIAHEGDVKLIASVGRDEKGNQQLSVYEDGITAGGDLTISGKNVAITGVTLSGGEEEDSVVRVASTEGDVTFNDIHEVKSSYSYDFQSNSLFTQRTEEVREATAISKTSSVNTGGKFIVDAAKDAVFVGGDYNASSGEISAKGDVTVKTSQDHAFKETKITESSLEFGYDTDVPGTDATHTTHSSLDGITNETTDYHSGAAENNMSSSNTKRPGAAATANTAGFHAGLKKVETITKDSSTVNKNASFNFSKGTDISADNTLDIGGMDLTVGDDATANLSATDIISTKYEDVNKSATEVTETFIGIKGESHSAVIDAANKHVNRAQKNINDDMEINAGMTAAEVGGDISNVVFNDIVGGSVSAGWSQNKEASGSETRSENINKIDGGTINLVSQKDITLQGIEVKASEVNIDAGGDLTLTAAKNSSKESSTTSQHNAALSWSAGAGATGAGIGSSYDYSGSQSTRDKSTAAYSNTQLNAGNVNIDVKGNMEMKGASVTAQNVETNVGGDLTITSVQDTSVETASGTEWGASLGIAVSTNGIIPTIAASGGGGDEKHISNVTTAQSGISATGEVKVTTGGDLNLTGGHIISDSQSGSVAVGGVINAVDLQDNIDSEGLYGGGGGGINYKGTPTVNAYADKLDTVHYKEDRHSTINVGIGNSVVKGNLNTNAEKTSTVVQDDKTAGNNISYTISKMPSNKGGKKQRATTEQAAKPGTSSVSDSSSTAVHQPGNSQAAKPGTSSVSDSSSTVVHQSGNSQAAKPGTSSVSDSSSTAVQRPGSSQAGKPGTSTVSGAGTDTVDASSKPAQERPTIAPTGSHVGGTGSASRPSSGNYAEATKPANNAPAKNPAKPATNISQTIKRDDEARKNTPVKRWPAVTPAKPIVGGPGSATRPDSLNYSGSARPANTSPRGSVNYEGFIFPPVTKKD